MSIIEKEGELTNPVKHLDRILEYNCEIQNRMMQNYNDSDGEILDSRLWKAQKMILEAIKLKNDMDPTTKEKELQREMQAEAALHVAKRMIDQDPELRARVAAGILRPS